MSQIYLYCSKATINEIKVNADTIMFYLYASQNWQFIRGNDNLSDNYALSMFITFLYVLVHRRMEPRNCLL